MKISNEEKIKLVMAKDWWETEELGGKIEKVWDYTVPDTDVTHRVVIIRKLSPTPAKYPRRFAQIKKQPL